MNPFMKAFVRGHAWLYESSNGKRGAMMNGRRVLLLTTEGRKTKKPRTVPVVPLLDGSEIYVVASMAGAPEHPAWYLNLEANPSVTVRLGEDRFEARAEILPEPKRSEVWQKLVAYAPDFAKYQEKTTRVIPIVRLLRKA